MVPPGWGGGGFNDVAASLGKCYTAHHSDSLAPLAKGTQPPRPTNLSSCRGEQRRIPMSFFSKLFGAKYNDEQLVAQAQIAIAADPLISDPTGLVVTSKKGVITLSGIVQRQ